MNLFQDCLVVFRLIGINVLGVALTSGTEPVTYLNLSLVTGLSSVYTLKTFQQLVGDSGSPARAAPVLTAVTQGKQEHSSHSTALLEQKPMYSNRIVHRCTILYIVDL